MALGVCSKLTDLGKKTEESCLCESSPIFSSRDDTLSFHEADYYQDLFYRTVKIGTEIEFALPKGMRRHSLVPQLTKDLKPSQDMNNLGRLGVFDVSKEHCGVEVRVIGRHPHWTALVDQYQRIVAPLWRNGVRIRPTCGLHFHLLGIALSEPIPEIVLANLWNMMRRYAPGIKFLTSGGDSWQRLCRRRQHNAHQEFLKLSPENLHCQDIQAILRQSFEVPEHQNFFNLEHVQFNEQGWLANFHIEFRFPDGDLSAFSITAKTFLFMAMLLKAVEVSKFGLLHVGKTEQWQRKKQLLNILSNNDGRLATSDTSRCHDHIAEYRDNSHGLLRFLKSIFILLDNPAELLLQSLAEDPISLRRIQGYSWQQIDLSLEKIAGPMVEMDGDDYRLAKVIELGLVEHCSDFSDWLVQAAAHVNILPADIEDRLAKFVGREPRWSAKLGRIIFLK